MLYTAGNRVLWLVAGGCTVLGVSNVITIYEDFAIALQLAARNDGVQVNFVKLILSSAFVIKQSGLTPWIATQLGMPSLLAP
ncbi:hypothetical protein ASPSYDRAFT_49742 [Aspergillus sydowii CBS 593.65]|uniref:Uncharacterized protein n=1 Tax=Aspergillus sydowii CBS 593.65 TaxID=1036612 RepID=A0A1L9T5A9_9EURO|nr:uncharacterized protein ASPSYDRAFT_49742 [Aspergillus sydowii CBS 593.65]OJJ54619.1 hypothetical protein ASPSYDRAFT_49742 [Aspergillus sydowii CBS 593.65]